MKVVILCGGRGTRMEKETEYRPKPMVEIGDKPILWHIMCIYSQFGYTDFCLCLGYKGEVIKKHFLDYAALNSDFTINTKTSKLRIHKGTLPDWNVTMVDTGIKAMTGARIKRIEPYIDTDDFMMTYGDAVSDINIDSLVKFHRDNGKIVSMTGVFPVYKSRFGELSTDSNTVVKFLEKPVNCAALTNGGFFVMKREIFDYLSDDDSCVFEKGPLENLVRDKQLCLFRHEGFWYCMDTPRDLQFLNRLWSNHRAPWMDIKCGRNAHKDWKEVLDKAL